MFIYLSAITFVTLFPLLCHKSKSKLLLVRDSHSSPKELHFASACMNNRASWWLSSQESACQHRIYEFDA